MHKSVTGPWFLLLVVSGASCSSSGTAGSGANNNSSGSPGVSSAGSAQTGSSGASTTVGGGGTSGGTAGMAGATAGGASGTGGSGSSGMSGGGSGGAAMSCGIGTAMTGDLTVNLSDLHQKISGFGASTAWDGMAISTDQADQVFSTTNGAGLSLLRIRVAPDGTTAAGEVPSAKLAQMRGAAVWATPWSPPASAKSGNTVNGGSITDGSRTSWANTLAAFVGQMKTAGVNLIALSAQNEPDANVTTYEACAYTPAALATFIGSYLAPAFSSANVTGMKLIGPETQNWCASGFPAYESALASNSAAWSALSIIATHEYGCDPSAYPAIQAAGKEFWETEVYDQVHMTADPSIASGLVVAKLMHDALTISSVNAWHYWWLRHDGDNGGLISSTGASKRLWVMGNFSRFVRPGYQRVGTSGTAPAGVTLSAYKNPSDGSVVVVAINTNQTSTSLPMFISGAPCSFTPWVTSAIDDLAAKTALPVSAGRFTATLAAQSVTSFVGKP